MTSEPRRPGIRSGLDRGRARAFLAFVASLLLLLVGIALRRKSGAQPEGTPKPAASEAKAGATTDDSTVTTAMAGAVTALIAALTSLGAATGLAKRMLVNHPTMATIAFFLVGLAVFLGLTAVLLKGGLRTGLLIAASAAFVLGLVLGLRAEVRSASISDRPAISGSVTSLDSGHVLFKATVKASGIQAGDRLVVRVWGIPAAEEEEEEEMGVDPAPGPGEQDELYYASSGPDAEGVVSHSIEFVADPQRFRFLTLTARMFKPTGEPSPTVNCDGFEVLPGGSLGSFTNVLNGCLLIPLEAPPEKATASPSPSPSPSP